MNLRILIYSNPLVVDKISKKFLYWKDSGFIFTKNLLTTLPDNWHYYWLIPENITEEQKQWFKIKPNMTLIPYPYSTSIHQNRYEFYGNVLKKAFPYTMDIDAVINNQPEVSANIKTWLENQRRDKSPIFNFFHWLDCKESRGFAQELSGYFWREWDGIQSADVSYFHNPYAKSLFDKIVTENINNPQPYSYDYFMPPATTYGHENPAVFSDKKIILFNHRLNNTTNWKFFLGICDRLYERRQDFVVWFTDDSDKAKSKMLVRPYVINMSLPDNQYGYLLEHAHFSVCTHKGYSTWNMAVIDALNEECFTLVPETEAVYKEMFGNYDCMYHQNNDWLFVKMNNLLNIDIKELKITAGKIKRQFPDYFSTGHLSKIKNAIETSILKRIDGKIPLKYDYVKKYITDIPHTSKETIVNKFWSFHVNSNFQLIRWNLLKDGIIDDTGKDFPSYTKEE
jgi:hypothetical protein